MESHTSDDGSEPNKELSDPIVVRLEKLLDTTREEISAMELKLKQTVESVRADNPAEIPNLERWLAEHGADNPDVEPISTPKLRQQFEDEVGVRMPMLIKQTYVEGKVDGTKPKKGVNETDAEQGQRGKQFVLPPRARSHEDSASEWVQFGINNPAKEIGEDKLKCLGDKAFLLNQESEAAVGLRTRLRDSEQAKHVASDFWEQREFVERRVYTLVSLLNKGSARWDIKNTKHALRHDMRKLTEIQEILIKLVQCPEETTALYETRERVNEAVDNYYVAYPRDLEAEGTSVTSATIDTAAFSGLPGQFLQIDRQKSQSDIQQANIAIEQARLANVQRAMVKEERDISQQRENLHKLQLEAEGARQMKQLRVQIAQQREMEDLQRARESKAEVDRRLDLAEKEAIEKKKFRKRSELLRQKELTANLKTQELADLALAAKLQEAEQQKLYRERDKYVVQAVGEESRRPLLADLADFDDLRLGVEHYTSTPGLVLKHKTDAYDSPPDSTEERGNRTPMEVIVGGMQKGSACREQPHGVAQRDTLINCERLSPVDRANENEPIGQNREISHNSVNHREQSGQNLAEGLARQTREGEVEQLREQVRLLSNRVVEQQECISRHDSSENRQGSRASDEGVNLNAPRISVGDGAQDFNQTLVQKLSEAITLNRLPVQEPEVFYGDTLIFPIWRASFELLVSSQAISDQQKQFYLRKYVGGEALESLKGFFLMRDTKSYTKAMAQLEKRYGSPFAISRAFREKLDNWPAIKQNDGKALRSLADFLQQCLIASEVIGQLAILDDAQYQRKIIDKLPGWLGNKWSRVVHSTNEKYTRYPTFAELGKFIEREADIACEPVFGHAGRLSTGVTSSSTNKNKGAFVMQANMTSGQNQSYSQGQSYSRNQNSDRSQNYSRSQNSDRNQNFGQNRGHGQNGYQSNDTVHRDNQSYTPSRNSSSVTKTVYYKNGSQGSNGMGTVTHGSSSNKCLCCLKDHHTKDCGVLYAKPVIDRFAFLVSKGLCLLCGSSQHQAKGCHARVECVTCKGKHLTMFHELTRQQEYQVFSQRLSYKPAGGRTPSSAQSQAQAGVADQSTLDNGGITQGATGNQTIVKTSLLVTESVPTDKPSGVGLHQQTEVLPELTSMIVPVYLSSSEDPDNEIMTYALLDTMSAVTFVSREVSEQLRVSTVDTSLRLHTITSHETSVSCQKITGLRVRAIGASTYVQLPPTFTTDALGATAESVPTKETATRHTHLNRIEGEMHSFKPGCTAGLLIGYNCPEALMPLEVIPGDPYGIKTVLGWAIVGSAIPSSHTDSTSLSHMVVNKSSLSADSNVQYIYRIKVDEISTAECLRSMERDFVEEGHGKYSQEDSKFLSMVGRGVEVNAEGHYEMPLPFRQNNPAMPNNREPVRQRTQGLKKQFERRENYKQDYQKFMGDIISNGHAERVPEDELEAPRKWYIPHHGVYNEKKPGKIRVVFDCSARHQGACINDVLLQGPDLINSLIGVLCRFRQGKIAFSCDIEKMFYQFHVKPEHRDYLRFLWWENGDTSGPLVDYRMKVHIFGATSSPGCANFGLKQVAEDHKEIDPDAAAFLKEDFYVDDGLHASDTVETAVTVLKKAREICERGKLRLHKIVSNSKELLAQFPQSELSSSSQTDIGRAAGESVTERTLGLQWDTTEDVFTFSEEQKEKPETRRGALSSIASLYDPLGFIAPVVLRGRLMLQQLCREGHDWDDAIPEEMVLQWREWMCDLKRLGVIKIDRSFFPSNLGEPEVVELHHFSDASMKGYGQCSYLRVKDRENKVHCSLVMAKSRVTPLKTVTVPRLELQAAVLSTKMAQFLEEQLRYDNLQHYFWTDSQIVLAYLCNEQKKFHVYVANRISQILQFTSASDWNYVPTEVNPADIASRGMKVDDLQKSDWYSGPAFLWEKEVSSCAKTFEVESDDVEVKSCRATFVVPEPDTTVEDISKRFSTKKSLLRGVAFILRFCARRKGVEMSRLESLQLAENRVVQAIQREHFTRPSRQLKNTLRELDCQTADDGLMRVGGRLSRSPMMQSHPVLLPRDSHVSLLWARECHEKLGHAGRTFTINELRATGYWIMGIRRVVGEVKQQCRNCIKRHGKTESQKMSDLPSERVTESAPFTYCGMDCFGPFLVKDRRSTVKRWGLIITCLSTRAVHIEMLDDMTTDALISGIRNLIAIRGNVRLIRCDCGTNFVGAHREFTAAKKGLDCAAIGAHEKRGLDCAAIAAQVLKFNCEFEFNPPTASHQGGVWERQIRTVRSVLNGMTGRINTNITSSALRTLFYEVMAIVNSRPLSVESLEDPTGPLPLTPNHILTMKPAGILPPPGVFEEGDIHARKQWRRVQSLADEFWRLWRRDYLQTLQKRRKWHEKRENITVGDIVVLREEHAFRNDWRLARVVEACPSKDGLVRSCKILLAVRPGDLEQGKGVTGKLLELHRPVTKLTVLVKVANQQTV